MPMPYSEDTSMEEATVFRARSRVKKAPNDAPDEGRRFSDSTAGQTWPLPLGARSGEVRQDRAPGLHGPTRLPWFRRAGWKQDPGPLPTRRFSLNPFG
jgi:hypothetical protein